VEPEEPRILLAKAEITRSNFVNVADHITYSTFELKAQLAKRLICIFVGTNLFVAALVAFLAWLDYRIISIDPANSNQRLIDRTVVMALIGATTIQVGIIAVSLFGSLFAKDKSRIPSHTPER